MAVSQLVVSDYKSCLILGYLLAGLMMCTQHIIINIYHFFKTNVAPMEKHTHPYKSDSHLKIDFIQGNKNKIKCHIVLLLKQCFLLFSFVFKW